MLSKGLMRAPALQSLNLTEFVGFAPNEGLSSM